jgi:hypothetical protein
MLPVHTKYGLQLMPVELLRNPANNLDMSRREGDFHGGTATEAIF